MRTGDAEARAAKRLLEWISSRFAMTPVDADDTPARELAASNAKAVLSHKLAMREVIVKQALESTKAKRDAG